MSGRRKDTSWPVYAVWANMVKRCMYVKSPQYNDYGGRGIKVCDRWRDFDNFLADMGEPQGSEMLERKDNDGDYEPSNCRWAPRSEQMRNKRNNVWVRVDGERLCVVDALKRKGMNMSTFYYRVREGGMTPQQAIDTPVRSYRDN